MKDITITAALDMTKPSKYHYMAEVYEYNKADLKANQALWLENFEANKRLLNKYKNSDVLFRDTQKYSQYECVVVGAGPTLDFDIADLKKYRRNVKIICVDSALHPLIKNNIKPDWVYTQNELVSTAELFSGFPTKDLKLVSSLFQSPEVFKKWKGDHYLYMPFDEGHFYDLMIGSTPKISKILKKPSTFASAIILARLIGFKRIFLLGGDYCFDDPKKMYCSDVLYSKQEYEGPPEELFKMDTVFFELNHKTRTTKELFYQSEDLFRMIMVESPDKVMNCSRNSILYNLDWIYFGEMMAYEGKSKNNYFEFASAKYNAGVVEVEMSNELTTNYFKAIMSKNMFDNRERVKREPTVAGILAPEAVENNKNKNCIVCGSGPSLQSTIPFLKEHRDKFTVIAVDSSLMPLYKSGIDPDLVLTIDAAGACGEFIKDYDGKNASLISSVGSHRNTSDAWKNRIYFYFPTPVKAFYYWLLMMLEYNSIPFLMPLNNCGSTSIILAEEMGFKNIAITGIDFSYVGNRFYAPGTNVEKVFGHEIADDEEKLLERLKGKAPMKTIDCMGHEVYTDSTFDFYSRSLYSVIVNRKYSNIVNVGGGILKVPYMPFDEYLNKVILAQKNI